MRKYLAIFLIGTIIPVLLSSCWKKDTSDINTTPRLDIPMTLEDTLTRYSSGEAAEITASLNSEKFSENTVILQKMIDDIIASSSDGQVNTGEIINVLLFQLQNTLNQGNYEYSESESRTAAAEIVAKILQYDPSYVDHPQILAFQGFGEEINKNYSGAQLMYETAIERSNSFSGTAPFRAQMYNQIGHIQSLLGNIEKAYELSYLAYMEDPTNLTTSLNIGRYLAFSGSVELAIPYFEYALNVPSLPVRAEIYFSLSSLMADKQSPVYDMNRAIEYAKLAIENNPNYPMGYYALANAYYMQGDTSNIPAIEENIKKSLELNPNGYNSLELRGLVKYDAGDFDGAIEDIKLAIDVMPNDMLQMENQRAYNTNRLYILMLLINTIENKKPIDESFEILFFSEQYGIDNLVTQLNRPNNGFLGSSGDKIMLYFTK